MADYHQFSPRAQARAGVLPQIFVPPVGPKETTIDWREFRKRHKKGPKPGPGKPEPGCPATRLPKQRNQTGP